METLGIEAGVETGGTATGAAETASAAVDGVFAIGGA